MSASSSIFSTNLQRMKSAGRPLSQVRPEDAVIYSTVRPNIKLVSTKESLPTAKLYDAVADASSTLRNVPVAISEIFGHSFGSAGAPLVGLTSLLYLVIGIGRARDSYKQMRDYQKIEDVTGANLAKAQIVENTFLVSGSAALAIVRICGAIQELFGLLNKPIVLSSAAMAVKAAAVWISSAFYLLFYAIFVARQAAVLNDLSKGNELREKLINSKDPIEALRQHVDLEMFRGSAFTKEECMEMALQEGAAWLEKLEKEVEEFHWDSTDESRRDHAYVLFRNNPEFMLAEMGIPKGFEKMSSEGRMVRFGRFIGQKRLAAKIENDLKRQLGPEAIEAFNKETPDAAAVKTALKSADWSELGVRWKTVAKIVLAVACAAGIIAGTIFSGGLALGIPLLVLGVAGLLWIVLADGAAFKSQWETGEVRKWDKFLVYFSVALSVIAVATLIAFTVLSGGAALYVAGIIFTTVWLIINARAVYVMNDNQKNPWKYQKEVTAQAFRKFLETKHTDEEREKIYAKMSLANREGIAKAKVTESTIEKAAEVWEKHLHDLRQESLETLMDRLDAASEIVHHLHQNVVAI